MSYINLGPENIDTEHICCGFSDRKITDSYHHKKEWIKSEFDKGYVFRRLDERAKVFIEYGPAEHAWVPVQADNYLLINCFWVSGKYKGHGHGKELLAYALNDAKKQGKDGLVTVAGTKKFHFMSDTKWLLKNGFVECQKLDYGFSLLVNKINPAAKDPQFTKSVLSGMCPEKEGVCAYYSNRCTFAEYHVEVSLRESCEKRNLPLKIIKLESAKAAQKAPSPATIFSLFYNGFFVTTDLSVCMDSRFDKTMSKVLD